MEGGAMDADSTTCFLCRESVQVFKPLDRSLCECMCRLFFIDIIKTFNFLQESFCLSCTAKIQHIHSIYRELERLTAEIGVHRRHAVQLISIHNSEFDPGISERRRLLRSDIIHGCSGPNQPASNLCFPPLDQQKHFSDVEYPSDEAEQEVDQQYLIQPDIKILASPTLEENDEGYTCNVDTGEVETDFSQFSHPVVLLQRIQEAEPATSRSKRNVKRVNYKFDYGEDSEGDDNVNSTSPIGILDNEVEVGCDVNFLDDVDVSRSENTRTIRQPKRARRRPQQSGKPKKYSCPFSDCAHAFDSTQGRNKHLRRVHQVQNASCLSKSRSGGVDMDKKNIQMPLQIHSIPSSTKSQPPDDIISGEQIQKEDKPINSELVCSVCSKSFPTKLDLKYHSESHLPASQRSFQCVPCGLGFAKASVLDRHLKTRNHKNQSSGGGGDGENCANLDLTASIPTSSRRSRDNRKSIMVAESKLEGETDNSDLMTDPREPNSDDNESENDEEYKQGDESDNSNNSGDDYLPKKSFNRRRVRPTGQRKLKLNTTKLTAVRGIYTCPTYDCTFTFKTRHGLRQHVRRVHSNNNSDPTKLQQRHRWGPGPITCEICSKVFKSGNDFKYHMETHIPDAERSFQCPICGKGFAKASMVERHKKTHGIGSYPTFLCPTCGVSVQNLAVHMRVHENTRPFQCPHCPKSFKSKNIMAYHELIHTGKKPYQCDKCPMTFRGKSTMRRHYSTHSEHKEFTCSFCGKGFRLKQNLREHEHVHTRELPYRCNFCGRRFHLTEELIQHRNELHAGQVKKNPGKGLLPAPVEEDVNGILFGQGY